ncbi:hypothetical protein KCV87_15785 [Actinosynnema pretiosum subsp. pretiosum]|uniref:Uncharacterized protein n=1 Tax=Actinosynnema pretiosum subsp. pretiosum TaxID=103721 RepID=A0AA45LC69_9PSEU|nr:hypothetical protein KCV87_15785 [Actinosynnema pretiosum subsp. pretiosum]
MTKDHTSGTESDNASTPRSRTARGEMVENENRPPTEWSTGDFFGWS